MNGTKQLHAIFKPSRGNKTIILLLNYYNQGYSCSAFIRIQLTSS